MIARPSPTPAAANAASFAAVGRTAVLASAAWLAVAAACGTGPPAGAEVTARDSAGVTIVENAAALAERSLAWLADDPDLRIGVAEGEEPYRLFRVTGAVQLPDASIAVVNAGAQEIRFFDGEGRFLRTVGRRGEGPGEFQAPQLLRPLGRAGELLIWDMMVNRFTLLDSGGVLRMVTPVAQIRMPQGWDGAGTVLVARTTAAAGLDTAEGVMANDFLYELVHLDGGDPVLIAEFSARIYHARIRGQPWFRAIPFDPQPSAAAGPGGFYVTAGDGPEIRAYADGGRLHRVLRVAREPERVRRADVDGFVEADLAGMRDEGLRAEWRARYARMPVPATVPSFRGLVVDETGHLWAEHFRIRAAEAPTWTVFDLDGAVLGRVRTPAGVTVLHIGEDFLIGLARSGLGVEQVVRYPLRRARGDR